VKQIKSSRNMQLIQPKVKELQKKYGHDRERLAQETMKLYKDSGTNPFASCMPLILQMPIFFALFRLLDQAAKNGKSNGFLRSDAAESFGNAELFGVVPLSASFTNADGVVAVQVVAALLVVAMTVTTFITQRQLMSKNMPPDALTGPYAQQQKVLLYVLPVVFAVGGIAFPIGVIIYWTTSNLWTMGQQFYVIRNNPAPGTEAARAKEERDRQKKAAAAAKHGGTAGGASGDGGVGILEDQPTETTPPESASETAAREQRQRQQPKKQSRSQRRSTRPPSGGKNSAQRSGKKK
jgi:YidC/Oxa1 family membrane protein insertase